MTAFDRDENEYYGEAGVNDHLDEIREEEDEEEGITREAQQAENDGRLQGLTVGRARTGVGCPGPTPREEITPSVREVRQFRTKVYAGIEAAREATR